MAIQFPVGSFNDAKAMLDKEGISDANFNFAKTTAESEYSDAVSSRGSDPYSESRRNIIGSYLIAHFALRLKSDIRRFRVLDIAVDKSDIGSKQGLNGTWAGLVVKQLDTKGLLQGTTGAKMRFL